MEHEKFVLWQLLSLIESLPPLVKKNIQAISISQWSNWIWVLQGPGKTYGEEQGANLHGRAAIQVGAMSRGRQLETESLCFLFQ